MINIQFNPNILNAVVDHETYSRAHNNCNPAMIRILSSKMR